MELPNTLILKKIKTFFASFGVGIIYLLLVKSFTQRNQLLLGGII